MITDVAGIRVGHWTDPVGLTGCTVVRCPPGTTGGVFVAGGAPATRETDLLAPGSLVEEVHAVLLTGGSAFGLAAADGVMRCLESEGVGFDVGVARVPIVPAAALLDLLLGDPTARPGAAQGEEACRTASSDERSEGNVGAGTGATVGKRGGPQGQMKGGLGGSSIAHDGLIVGVVAAVNAFGDVLDERGEVLAGARSPDAAATATPSTTLACVATNARLSKEQANRVAKIASAGMARAIAPAFTMVDGDVIFVLATNRSSFPVDLVGALAADALADAIRRGVRAATSVEGAPAIRG